MAESSYGVVGCTQNKMTRMSTTNPTMMHASVSCWCSVIGSAGVIVVPLGNAFPITPANASGMRSTPTRYV